MKVVTSYGDRSDLTLYADPDPYFEYAAGRAVSIDDALYARYLAALDEWDQVQSLLEEATRGRWEPGARRVASEGVPNC